MNTNLPKFVERGGMQCHLQPFACSDVTMYGFFLEGKRENLQSTVDRYLNQPAGGAVRYHVLTSSVMVTFAYFAEGRSTEPPDSEMGFVPETSCTFWIPTAVVKKELGFLVAERVNFFVPYIVVDNGYSMTAGREIYGFPKELGTFRMPLDPAKADQLSVSTLVIPQFSPSSPAVQRTLVEVNRTTGGDGIFKEAWRDSKDFLIAIKDFLAPGRETVLPGLGLLKNVFEDLTHRRVPAVFLKQFRDAADGHKACYQGIIEAGVGVTGFHSGGLLDGEFEFNVANFDSHPLHGDLGLDSARSPARLPFYMVYDMLAENGKEVWRANSNG